MNGMISSMKAWFGKLYADVGGRKGFVRFMLICALLVRCLCWICIRV